MPIPLPNLDDRRWADLVEEGRSLIPLYAPEWTNHNASDPGITMLELFAWIAEMDIYQINRIPDRHKRRFLALVGLAPNPPVPAHTALRFELQPAVTRYVLPAGSECSGIDVNSIATPFRTLEPVTVSETRLQSVVSFDSSAYVDLTGRWSRGEALYPMGKAPDLGAALYLGFDKAMPTVDWTSLYYLTGSAERLTTPHHSARVVWEYLDAGGQWVAAQADDTTRSLTQSGGVRIKPGVMKKAAIGGVKTQLYYLRARLSAGQFDTAPSALGIFLHTVAAEQSNPVFETWPILAGAPVTGPAPNAGDTVALQASFNKDGQVASLSFGPAAGTAQFTVLKYNPGASVTIRGVRVGVGTGAPYQTVVLPGAPIDQAGLHLYTNEGGAWVPWTLRGDLAASKSAGSDFLLNPNTGQVSFGDGARGRVPGAGVWIVAEYRSTRAAAGSLPAGAVNQLPQDPAVRANLAAVSNPAAATGGLDAERLSHAIGRAILLREAPLRAVTPGDYEMLAEQTPGTRIARVTAIPNSYPGFGCIRAPGVVTVLLVPSLPPARPVPGDGLKRAVTGYLEARRIIGTRVIVIGPEYLQVTVQASVRAFPTASKTQVRQAIVDALNAFLDPLSGGPDRTGWPFGRDVYRTEIMQVIDQTPGVDHVESLALLADGCGPMCGNLCLRPSWLVTPGAHQIEVS